MRLRARAGPEAPSVLHGALLLLLTALLAACGTTAPPGPVSGPTPDSTAEPDVREPVEDPTLRRVEAPEPPAPWLPFGVRWSPVEPREGDVVGLRLLQPETGRRPIAVEGSLLDRPVRFARVDGGWFGVGAAPVEASGPATLELRFRLSPDSTVVQRQRIRITEREFPATRLSVAPRYSSPGAEALARIERERETISATLAEATRDWLPEGPFVRPRDTRVTSPFGQRRLFNDELQSRHTGVDLAGPTGAPVRAAARGRVALTGDFYYAGNAVYLDHGLGVFTGYFHLSEISVAEGDTVEAGEIVGEVGATGRVTGPHLHWSAYVGGVSLDARSLLSLSDLLRPPTGAEAAASRVAPPRDRVQLALPAEPGRRKSPHFHDDQADPGG
jgi:murein DD-endopeptidase MepM/ murein hydrolase activator NlpD